MLHRLPSCGRGWSAKRARKRRDRGDSAWPAHAVPRPYRYRDRSQSKGVGRSGRQPQLGLRLLVSIMASMSSGEGPLGPGLPRRFGENKRRYLRCTNAAWKARRVDVFSTTAGRSRRLGRMKSVHTPAMTRSIGRRFGARSRPRFRITSWCFTSRGSATSARAPPGPISFAMVANRWMNKMARSRIARPS